MSTVKKTLSAIGGGFQKFGPAIMPVIAVLPIAGLLLGVGSALSTGSLIELVPALGAEPVQLFASLVKAVGNLIIGNLGLFFAVGIAMNMAGKKSMAAFSAVLAYLVMNTTISTVMGITADDVAANTAYATVLGINTLQSGVFGGLLTGIMVYQLYKRFSETQLPQALSFFQGERLVPIVSTLGGILLGCLMMVIWPPVQWVFEVFTSWLTTTPLRFLAVFLYGFVMRLVQAFGLQHLIYPFFYFQMGSYTTAAGTVVTGESSIFFAQIADGVPVTVGGFMTGSYVNSIMCCAIALAIYRCAKPERRKYVKGLLIPAVITVAFTGVSEPIEFMYLLISPFLWVVNSAMVGLGYAVTDLLQIRLGTGLAGNVIDYVLYGILPQSNNFLLLIPVGAVFFAVQYFLFSFFIRRFDIKLPGREDDEALPEAQASGPAGNLGVAAKMIELLGGKENIISFENCFTRVRAVVKNRDVVSKDSFRALGASGTVFPGDSGVQVIFGPQSEAIVNAMKRVMAGEAVPEDEPVMAAQTLESAEKIMMGKENFASPATGTVIPLAELADGVFSAGMMGPGFAVVPQADATGKVEVVSPVNGTVVAVFPTKHAFGIKSDLGKEVVVHVGIDTVDLQGKGFESTVSVGDTIEVGTPLVTFDEKIVKDAGCNPAVVVVITNAMGKVLSVSPMGTARSADDLDVEIA